MDMSFMLVPSSWQVVSYSTSQEKILSRPLALMMLRSAVPVLLPIPYPLSLLTNRSDGIHRSSLTVPSLTRVQAPDLMTHQ
jgi:hypothetical protein